MSPRVTGGVATPDDLVLVGHITGAFGVNGWVRVRPYSRHADALLNARCWWLEKEGVREFDLRQAKMHGEEVVAQLVGIVSREAAEALKGSTLHVSRRHFPLLEDNEFYWVDLIGLSVRNLQGELFGAVAGVMESGAHAILRVVPEGGEEAGKRQQEILIPFIEKFVPTVDQKEKVITVDWERDYSH